MSGIYHHNKANISSQATYSRRLFDPVNESMIKHNMYLIKAIAFDMDGVVIDSNRAIEAFWHRWARHQHIPFTQQTIDTFIHGRTTLETIQELFTQSSPEVKERIRADAMDFDWTMQPSLIPSIHAFLPLLASHVANIALVTSAPKKEP